MTEKPSQVFDFKLENLEIKCKILDQKTLKAIVALNFGPFVVRGFRISASKFSSNSEDENKQDELWVIPPSYKDVGGKYHPIFFAPDKELWENMKKLITEAYNTQSNMQEKKKYGLPDDF